MFQLLIILWNRNIHLLISQKNNLIFGPLDQSGHGVSMVLNNTDNQCNKSAGPFEFSEGSMYRLISDPQQSEGSQFSLESMSQKPTTFSMPMQIVEGYGYHVFVCMGQRWRSRIIG